MEQRVKILKLLVAWAENEEDAKANPISISFHPTSAVYKLLENLVKDTSYFVSFEIVGKNYRLRMFDCSGEPRLLKGDELSSLFSHLLTKEEGLVEPASLNDRWKELRVLLESVNTLLLQVCRDHSLVRNEEFGRKSKAFLRICNTLFEDAKLRESTAVSPSNDEGHWPRKKS